MGKKYRSKDKNGRISGGKFRFKDDRFLYEDEILGDEIFWPEKNSLRDMGVLNTNHNEWYERLVCKRLAKRIANRKVGLRASR